MARNGAREWGLVGAVAISVAFLPGVSNAAPLDSRGEMKLGVRTYVNARIGTQATDSEYDNVGDVVRALPDDDPQKAALSAVDQTLAYRKSRTFPYSPAGHLRQNRFFTEVELKHDLARLQKEGFGPLALLNLLPFRVRNLSYGLTFRGEYDGIYDYGPSEFRTASQWQPCSSVHASNPNDPRGCLSSNPATGAFVEVGPKRQELRNNASSRFRLFQAYFDADLGSKLWMRFGRQILSWGETDSFRLLDNINPIDSSFGGFLVSLDERRVPLDMLRLQYRLGDVGPAYDTFLELYGAIDSGIGYSPGTPAGSPWSFPNTGVPGATTQSQITEPARTWKDVRGGGRFVFNIGDGTYSLAHYYTYVDVPNISTNILPSFPVDVRFNPQGVLNAWDGIYSVRAYQTKQQVQITGGSMTYALPQFYSILRSEIAYFKDEPRFSQSQLDPFIYHYFQPGANGEFTPISPSALRRACQELTAELQARVEAGEDIQARPVQGNDICKTTGGQRRGDSLNMAFGIDVNQFIRFLNPNQTFFISTQFFYRHLFGAIDRKPIPGRIPMEGEVLPVTEADFIVAQGGLSSFGAVEPSLIKQPTDTFLHTLFITTAYRSGTINPAMVFFYDWGGALVYQPSVTFIYDPFRFSVDYSILQAGTLKAGSGVSLLRDRDSIQFRFEYVI